MIDTRQNLRAPSGASHAYYSGFDISQGSPNWDDPHARQLSCLIHDGGRDALYLMFNAGTEAARFQVSAPPPGRSWRVVAETYSEPSLDASLEQVYDHSQAYLVDSRSSVLLCAAT